MSRFILTGDREAGKTTFCQALCRAAAAREMTLAGILTLTEREEELIAVDISTTESRRLAVISGMSLSGEYLGENGTPRTGKWTFDAETILWGNRRIRQAVTSDLFVLDEAGILEFERDQGWVEGMARIDCQMDVLSLAVIRPELIDPARKRWKEAEILRIERPDKSREKELIRQILDSVIE